MLFYTILLLLFSVLWGAMGLGNKTSKRVNPAFYGDFATATTGYPGVEYKEIGLFVGNVFDVLRTTLGDYNCIGTSLYLDTGETYLFWVMWAIVVIVGWYSLDDAFVGFVHRMAVMVCWVAGKGGCLPA